MLTTIYQLNFNNLTNIMSAVIAIMNKHGAALAADSAVTISGGQEKKIYQNANKIFTLSKYHPVSIMVYNSASFMDTPWEVIIKVYRNQLGDKSFKTVEGYYKDFVRFLNSESYYTEKDEQRSIHAAYIESLLEKLNDEAFDDKDDLLTDPTTFKDKLNELINDVIQIFIKNPLGTHHKCPEFENYTEQEYRNYASDLINDKVKEIYNKELSLNLSAETLKNITHFLYQHFTKNYYYMGYSGLVFVGFGEDEIYPHLIPLHVNSAFDNKLRYHVEENDVAHISDKEYYKSIAICSFAQKDVINTILYGVDPDFQFYQEQNFKKFVLRYQEHINKIIEDAPDELKKEVQSYDIDGLVKEMKKMNQEIQMKKFVFPLFRALKGLSKEDLAEMAESLIKLTYLKRRMMFHEESVSGPIDVAIITKGDGFIWQKRKHYFERDLNHHFFQNYLNH